MATDLQTDLVVAKVTSMLALGGSAFIIILLPVFVNKRVTTNTCSKVQKKNESSAFVLSLFLSFGGGVLLCTTFLHLLPEVTENIAALQDKGIISSDFPLSLPPLIMCCGFFVMYIVEEVVHKFLHSRQHKKALKRRKHPLNVSSDDLVGSEKGYVDTYKEMFKQDMLQVQVAFSPPCEEDIKIYPSNLVNYGTSCSHSAVEEVNHNSCSDPKHDLHYDHDHRPRDHDSPHHHDPESGAHIVFTTDDTPSLRELLLVLALTVHEGFEGLAIGLEDTVGSVWYLMAAVAVHKSVIAFCIGIELVSGHISLLLSLVYAVIFAVASPFGIGVGLLLSSTAGDDSVTMIMSVFLQGLATGTLLYVVFFEILKKDEHAGGMWQMLVIILGFTIMAFLMVVIDP